MDKSYESNTHLGNECGYAPGHHTHGCLTVKGPCCPKLSTVGQTVGQNVPVDVESALLLPLVLLRKSKAQVPVTGTERNIRAAPGHHSTHNMLIYLSYLVVTARAQVPPRVTTFSSPTRSAPSTSIELAEGIRCRILAQHLQFSILRVGLRYRMGTQPL